MVMSLQWAFACQPFVFGVVSLGLCDVAEGNTSLFLPKHLLQTAYILLLFKEETKDFLLSTVCMCCSLSVARSILIGKSKLGETSQNNNEMVTWSCAAVSGTIASLK